MIFLFPFFPSNFFSSVPLLSSLLCLSLSPFRHLDSLTNF